MSKALISLVVIFLFLFAKFSEAANILYYLGVSTYSQRAPVTPYLEALASKGHNVTIFSPYFPKSHKSSLVTEFSPIVLQKFVHSIFGESDLIEMRVKKLHGDIWWSVADLAVNYCNLWLNDPEVMNWINHSHFDLVIMDSVFCECAIGIAYKFKAPHIVFATLPNGMWQHDLYGILPETSWIPDVQHGDSPSLNSTLIQRTTNTLRILYWHFYRRFIHYPKLESMLRQFLNIPDMPPMDELARKPSLVLMNHHYSVDYAKSFPPLCVSIGGIHVIGSMVHPLPEEIEQFINNCGQNDLVYMSFGSAVRAHLMSDDLKFIFMETFGKFQDICFLIKWEGEMPMEPKKNIFISKWMPQSDILAHPRIRAFITHAGLLGIQEAVYYGVPLIAFPIFCEQNYNAEKVHNVGYGIKLEITTLTQPDLEYALKEILGNSKYKDKITQISSLFRDRPDKPIETAVWWTEFVLRRKDSTLFMIPLAAQQTWYERRLLDVWSFVFLLIVSAILVVIGILLFSLKIFLRLNNSGVLKKKIN